MQDSALKNAPSSVDDQFMYRQLVHGLPIAIYGCDKEGRITFYNEAAANLWGREVVIGEDSWCGSWKIYRIDGSLLPLDECPMAVALKEERAVTGEEIIVERPDGTRLNVLPHPQPIFNNDGIIIGAVNSLVDITKQKNDQRTLIELERSNNELTSFSYIASHDLQEPLRKIIIFSDKLKNQLKDSLSPENKEYLERITSSSKRMRQLIEDVLDFSRVSSPDKKFVPVDLNEILNNTLADFDHRISEKKAEIITDELPVVSGISLQMSQLFHNLISNALKFSAKDKFPVITITSRQISSAEIKKYPQLNAKISYCEIIISDNGIGFSQKYAEQIFTIFQRLHGQSEYSGTGIGLALCRKIVDNHNGIIFARSKEGSGAVFNILLPLIKRK